MLVGGLLGFLSLLLLVYCVLDVATSRASDVRTLPKALWFVVALVPVLGPAAWFLAGRPESDSPLAASRLRPDAPGQAQAPDNDEAFLRELRRRTNDQRRRAEEQRSRDEGDRPS